MARAGDSRSAKVRLSWNFNVVPYFFPGTTKNNLCLKLNSNVRHQILVDQLRLG